MGDCVRIGIVDSGVSCQDAALSNSVREAIDLGVAADNDGGTAQGDGSRDESGHGTTCARIIAAIAPTAEFYVARVLDAKNQGHGADLVTALEWLADKRVDVVNLSLGTRCSAPRLASAF